MYGEQIPRVSHQEKYTARPSLAHVALMATALYATSPDSAHAWETEVSFDAHEVESVLEEIGMPSLEVMPDGTTVTHFTPATNGKYVVHIRARHKDPFADTPSESEFGLTVENQHDIYNMVRAITDGQPESTFFREGVAPGPDLEAKHTKELRQDLLRLVSKAREDGTVDARAIYDAFASLYASRGYGPLFPRIRAKYAELLLSTMQENNIELGEGDRSFFTSALEESVFGSQGDLWLYEDGGLDVAYYQGFVADGRLQGCEDASAMNALALESPDVVDRKIDAINKERELFMASCMAQVLHESQTDSFVVTVQGGMHNFSQELSERGDGVGYIVLTPPHYSVDHYSYSMD